MRIGIDIDGVLTNLAQYQKDYFSKYCTEHNICYEITSKKYKLHDMFNVSKKIGDAFWDEMIWDYSKHYEIREFASEIINKLKREGHEIYIITARWPANESTAAGEIMRNNVKAWLNKNNVVYDNLIFSKGNNEDKTQEITDYTIDVMIEDNPNNINQISKLIPVICMNEEYNSECHGKNIIRCYSWYDIYNKIQSML